jgi:hypothetical protein
MFSLIVSQALLISTSVSKSSKETKIKKEFDLGMRHFFFHKISVTLGEQSTEYYEVNFHFNCNCLKKLHIVIVECIKCTVYSSLTIFLSVGTHLGVLQHFEF